MRFVILSLLLHVLTGSAWAAPATGNSYAVGLTAQILYPDRLPDFRTSLATYGLMGAIPIGDHAIQIQAGYGKADTLSIYVVETQFRLNIETPFFNCFLLAGVHYFH